MSKSNKKKEDYNWPSIYDYFYYDYRVVEKLCDIGLIKEEFSKNNIQFNDNFYGYLYIIELEIIKIIGNIESLIPSPDLYELVHWGGKKISDKEIRNLCKEEESIKYILDLNKIRKNISGLRFNKIDNETFNKQLENILQKLVLSLKEINEYLVKVWDAKRISDKPEEEKIVILNRIIYNYNLIEYIPEYEKVNSNFLDILDVPATLPIWPHRPFFYLITDEIKASYSLQNPKIKSKMNKYFNGYKLCLIFLYKWLLLNEFSYDKSIIELNSWDYLDEFGHKMLDLYIRRKSHNFQLFDMKEYGDLMDYPLNIKEIKSSEQLEIIFKGRRINVVKEIFSGGEDNSASMFEHLLFGAVSLYEAKLRPKPKLIEFKQIINKHWIEYSYAIYFPIGGAIWDSSHWIFFDKLDIWTTFEPNLDFKNHLQKIIKIVGDKIDFFSVEVEGSVLKKYIRKKDKMTKTHSSLSERFNYCKGLTTEFLAFLYLNKKFSARLVDIHRDVGKSDADAIAENDDNYYVVQAKQYLPFRKQILKSDVVNHLKMISRQFKDKPVKKILFVMHLPTMQNTPDRDTMVLFEEKKKTQIKVNSFKELEKLSKEEALEFIDSTHTSIMESDIVRKRGEIKDYLKENDIDLIYYDDLEKLLSNNMDFVNKIDNIYEIHKVRNLFEDM